MKKLAFSIFLFALLSLIPLQSVLAYCVWTEKETIEIPGQAPIVTLCIGDETQANASSCGNNAPSPNHICCCGKGDHRPTFEETVAELEKPKSKAKFEIPDLAITIPGLNFSEGNCVTNDKGETSCTVNWIGEYVGGAYKYAAGIAGILAVIVLMIAGILWLVSGGDATKIKQSKELIIGGISGLVLILCSYILLYQINPDLTRFKSLSLGYIDEIVLEGDSKSPNISLNTVSIANLLGLDCQNTTVNQIIEKAKGKITYSQDDRGKSAPGGFVYLDCSSFAAFVLKCANDKSIGQNTSSIFSEQTIWDQKIENLNPGDLVGWAPQNNKNQAGHVMIYLGNGRFGDCHGGSGKQPGNCISSNISLEKVKTYSSSHSDGALYVKRY